MPAVSDGSSAEILAVVEQEEGLLQKVQRSLLQAAASLPSGRPESELRSIESLRALREDAMRASEDDLPALLHEMGVRQRLLERPAGPSMPDPACPYLAHLRIREGKTAKDYLLGRVNYVKTSENIRIVDWRIAPIAQLFYRYREGDEFEEELPGRVMEGQVEVRRVLVIEDGRLARILGDAISLVRDANGLWAGGERGELSFEAGGAGTAARAGILGIGVGTAGRAGAADVTALLDAEQFAAISTPVERPLVVLGTAGSGKTTVALHRLARIAAQHAETHPLDRIGVVVPEQGLARLSRRLLAPLGVGSTQVETLDDWTTRVASAVFGVKLPPLCEETPALVSSLKRHPALYAALRDRFRKLNPRNATFRGLRRRLAELFSDHVFLASVVDAAKGQLSRAAIGETVRHTMHQLADTVDKQLEAVVVPELLKTVDGRPIAEGTPEEIAGTIDVDELAILLFLRAWKAGVELEPYAHAVLDEAEDFALFELFVMGKLLGEEPSVTLAGDEAQQTCSSFAGWQDAVGALGLSDPEVCRLSLSYRCPGPVVELAQKVLGHLATEPVAPAQRGGAPVGLFSFPDEGQAHLFLSGAIRDLAAREPHASIAVIASSEQAARSFHALLADLHEARLVHDGEFGFQPGVDVTHVDDVKGLEFDYVVIPDANADAYPATDEARRRLHVAITRTAHQLWLVAGGEPSPLIR